MHWLGANNARSAPSSVTWRAKSAYNASASAWLRGASRLGRKPPAAPLAPAIEIESQYKYKNASNNYNAYNPTPQPTPNSNPASSNYAQAQLIASRDGSAAECR